MTEPRTRIPPVLGHAETSTDRLEATAAPWRTRLRSLHVVAGAGVLEELGSHARELGGRRVLLVTDAGICRAGHCERALLSLERHGCRAFVFDQVSENPTTEDVGRGAALARREGVDLVVGLGGGSPMDCAKGVNFLYTNGGTMEDYWGFNHASKPMLASIGVPATAGTGSEAQSYALISRAHDHVKMACGDEKARFRTVLLDPQLVATAPPSVVAVAGLDALSHAVESFVTQSRSPISQMFARDAWRRLEGHYERALAGPGDETWEEMLLGAHLAGTAIELSMLGAAHACANPLTARYGVAHGIAVGLFLPHVVAFNAGVVATEYERLAEASSGAGTERGGGAGTERGGGAGAMRLRRRIEELRRAAGLPERLRDVGVPEGDLEALAGEAACQWTARANPRAVGREELLELYRQAY